MLVAGCGDDSATSTEDAGAGDATAADVSASDAGADTNSGATSTSIAVTLSASSTNVTADGDVTLTATVAGGTPTSVAFVEGSTTVGTKAASPFTQSVSYTFAENGTHTFVAKATMADGSVVTSAPVAITVAISANGVFVNPATGVDTNTGTQASPVKTIQKAVTLATTGQTIYLMDGTYDTASQTTLTWSLGANVFVRGLSGNGVTLTGNGSSGGFSFSNGGGIRKVAFQAFNSAIQVSAGTFKASDLKFSNVSLPIFILGNTVATIDESGVPNFLANVPASSLAALLAVDNTSDVTFKGAGAIIMGVTVPGNAFFARGAAKLKVSDVTFTTWPGHVLVLNDNAQVKLTNVTLTGSGLATSSGIDQAAILMGGQNTAIPLTEQLELENTSITASPGPAIALTLYSATASTPVIKLTNSHIDSNLFHGLTVNSGGALSPLLTVTLTATNSTFKGNTGFGIVTPLLTGTFTGGEISNNSESGVQIGDNALVSSLKMRGTKLDANGQYGILFGASGTSTLDLGKAGDDGGLVFTNVPVGKAAVRMDPTIVGSAIGNTWMPNEQGANASGKYVSTTTLTGASPAGRNAAIASGSLIVAP